MIAASPSLFDLALEIAEKENKLLGQLAEAIEANDRDTVWKISKLLCGLPPDAA